jgi:hypothetical protein
VCNLFWRYNITKRPHFHFDEFLITLQSRNPYTASVYANFLASHVTTILCLWGCMRVAFVIREITQRQRSRSEIYDVITHRIAWKQFLLGCFPGECQHILSFRHQSLCRSERVGSRRPVMVSIWPTKIVRTCAHSCINDTYTKQVNYRFV